jgi:hypothetical protein
VCLLKADRCLLTAESYLLLLTQIPADAIPLQETRDHRQ